MHCNQYKLHSAAHDACLLSSKTVLRACLSFLSSSSNPSLRLDIGPLLLSHFSLLELYSFHFSPHPAESVSWMLALLMLRPVFFSDSVDDLL